MSPDDEIAGWIQMLQSPDPVLQHRARRNFRDRFAKLLKYVARRNIDARVRTQHMGSETLVNQALYSFFASPNAETDGAASFQRQLSARIVNKARSLRRRANAQKRGLGEVRSLDGMQDQTGEPVAMRIDPERADQSRRYRPRLSAQGIPAAELSPDQVAADFVDGMGEEYVDALADLLAKIPADMHSVTMWALAGYDESEIAAELGVSGRTVKRDLADLAVALGLAAPRSTRGDTP
jgi:DNA-directed RNA polymerase specialized sigma24 family protein